MNRYSEYRDVHCVFVEQTLQERCDKGIVNVNENLPPSRLTQRRRAAKWRGPKVNVPLSSESRGLMA
jgi:hypothetical protein